MRRRAIRLAAALAGVGLAATVGAGQVRYMLWDSMQLPAYRQCAADFARRHPGTTVKVTQAGWDDYWTAISTGILAEVAPDVFANHLSKYPEFVANDLLVDLAPYIARDRLDLSIFPPGLVAIWGRGGHQYGLPKDWDTVGLLVDMAQAKRAGVSLAELQQMRWNPRDGGSFEQVVRRLTVDTQGRPATDPRFDRRNVATYGYQNPGAGGMAGQIQWSHFAVSNGFRFQDAPWALPLRYDDPRLAQTLDWLAGLPAKGLSAPFEIVRGASTSAMFLGGKVAMIPDGAWMIGFYAANAKFEHAWVPLPTGPLGRRASMLNGLGDSMWVGSRVKEEAWAWMKYLASADCQSVVAASGVVFPAIRGMAERVIDGQRRKGIDASAFLAMADAQTFPMPIAANGAQVDELMKAAIESVLLGRQPAAPALREASRQIDALMRGAAAGRSGR